MARYGLPDEVRFCTRCVISNQRPSSVPEHLNTPEAEKPTIHFDSEGVCSACRVAEKKAQTDWAERDRELKELCAQHRSKDGSFDVVVPGSGGKDSFYAAHKLKYEYGMHPITCTWAPAMYTDWGWRNFQRWIHAGFTNHLVTPNGKVHRLLTRIATERLFHPFQAFIFGQKNLAPKFAASLGIKLVVYGESEAEYGNPKAETETSRRDHAYFSGNPDDVYLGGASLAELYGMGLNKADLEPYLPLRPDEREKVEVHYLGYYLKWHPQTCYYHAVEHGGFEASPERTPGTYSKYSSIDDKMDDFHYLTTFLKFGIGRATYDAAQEIRSGDIDRNEGVALVNRFDGEWPARFTKEINEYLSVEGFEPMTDRRWQELADQFRPQHLWSGDVLRHRVSPI